MRAFVAGASRGGPASLLSLGRGMGVANRTTFLSQAIQRPGTKPVQIVSKEGAVLARSVKDGKSTVLMRGNQPVFRSNPNATNQRDTGKLDHVDVNGWNVGNSKFVNANRVEHYAVGRGARERKVGADLILRAGRLIRHLDHNDTVVGESDLEQNGEYTEVVADQPTEEYLTELAERDERHPELVIQRQRYHNTSVDCQRQVPGACRAQNIERRRLRDMERNLK